MLKYFSIIISFSIFETSKDLMADFDNENGNSEQSEEVSLTTPQALHFGSRFSDQANWIASYQTVNEGDPLGLPVWTRRTDLRHESPQVSESLYDRRVVEGNPANFSRGRGPINRIRSLLSFKKTPDSHY